MNATTVRRALSSFGYDAESVDQFLAYHKSHPGVWLGFEACAKSLLKEGRRKIGAKLIAERLRYLWDRPNLKPSQMEYAINNSYTALYARIFVAKYPQYRQRFELRMPAGLRAAVQTSFELRGGRHGAQI